MKGNAAGVNHVKELRIKITHCDKILKVYGMWRNLAYN